MSFFCLLAFLNRLFLEFLYAIPVAVKGLIEQLSMWKKPFQKWVRCDTDGFRSMTSTVYYILLLFQTLWSFYSPWYSRAGSRPGSTVSLSGMMNKFFSGLQSHLCDKSEPSVLFPILLILTILTTFPCEVRKTRLHYFMLDNWKRTFCRLRGHSPNNDAHSNDAHLNDAKSCEEKKKDKM